MKTASANSRGMEFFDALRDMLQRTLKNCGADDDLVQDAIRSLEKAIADEFGGQQIYVPRATLELLLRNEQIYRDYDGTNLDQLCREYKLCMVQIRQIINNFRGNKKVPPAPVDTAEVAEQHQLF